MPIPSSRTQMRIYPGNSSPAGADVEASDTKGVCELKVSDRERVSGEPCETGSVQIVILGGAPGSTNLTALSMRFDKACWSSPRCARTGRIGARTLMACRMAGTERAEI